MRIWNVLALLWTIRRNELTSGKYRGLCRRISVICRRKWKLFSNRSAAANQSFELKGMDRENAADALKALNCVATNDTIIWNDSHRNWPVKQCNTAFSCTNTCARFFSARRMTTISSMSSSNTTAITWRILSRQDGTNWSIYQNHCCLWNYHVQHEAIT